MFYIFLLLNFILVYTTIKTYAIQLTGLQTVKLANTIYVYVTAFQDDPDAHFFLFIQDTSPFTYFF